MTPNNIIIERCIDMLSSYIMSNDALRLNDSFAINFKVLSVQHTEENVAEGRMAYDQVGSGRSRRQKLPFLFSPPEGYPNNKLVFTNKCGIVALLMGHFLNLFYEGHHEWKKFFLNQDITNVNGISLYDEYVKLCHQCDEFSGDGPFSLRKIIPLFSDAYKYQVVVFSEGNPHAIEFMYPPKADLLLKPIFLLLAKEHVLLVTDIISFFSHFGFICLFCKKFLKSYKNKHYCTKTVSCRACRRVKLSQDDYANKMLDMLYCAYSQDISVCKDCNLETRGEECQKMHRQFCSRGWHCDKCAKYQHINRIGQSTEQLKRDHDCCKQTCRSCFSQMEEDHLCEFTKPKIKDFFDNLCFLSFTYVNASCNSCNRCHSVKEKCQIHLRDEEHLWPNMIVAFREHGPRHGAFEGKTFADSRLKMKDPTAELEFFYLPDRCRNMPLNREKKSGIFRNPLRLERSEVVTVQSLRDKPDPMPLEALMLWLLSEEMHNYTIIVDTYIDMVAMLPNFEKGPSQRVIYFSEHMLGGNFINRFDSYCHSQGFSGQENSAPKFCPTNHSKARILHRLFE
jgi:hypothetical protein